MEIPEGYEVKYLRGRGPARVRGKTILIPEWESRKEKEESLAHEIAHIRLGHRSDVEGQESISDFLPKEIEAQKLGRVLLGRKERLPPGSIAKIIENTTRFLNRGTSRKIAIMTVAEIFWEDSDRLGLPRKDVERAIVFLEEGETKRLR